VPDYTLQERMSRTTYRPERSLIDIMAAAYPSDVQMVSVQSCRRYEREGMNIVQSCWLRRMGSSYLSVGPWSRFFYLWISLQKSLASLKSCSICRLGHSQKNE